MLSSKPLFSLAREGHEEVCVHGEIALVGARGALFGTGDPPSLLPARSLLKPLQFQATRLALEGRELQLPHVAALGSISATAHQVGELMRWHGAPALQEPLLLPAALPLDPGHRSQLLERGSGPSRYFHPCFSKHMAILEACRSWGWSLAEYDSPSHPFHAELLRLLAPHLDRGPRDVEFVRDGCRLLTPVLSLREIARIYRHLAASASSAEARIRQAMQRHPEWIGASDRFDTRLMQQNPRRLIAKEGADGLLAIGVGPTQAEPDGVGLVIKLAAGHQPAWAALAATPFLEQLGLLPVHDPTPGQDVIWHADPRRVSPSVWDISPSLDESIAVWPGDTAFRRELVTEIGAPGSSSGASWNLTVSSIRTTVHVGAHADAPNHFIGGGVGIDAVPLTPYRGLCQVIDLVKARGSLIAPEDLAGISLRAPRLLFKTGSYPDPQQFNTDFIAFSAELIPWLEARGVILIGIDTPSIDPFSSKSLPTHHATRRGSGVAILEGLELSQVRADLYELIALPLRLQGADASPVRATLWPLR
jgi:arylformamidase